MKRVKQLEYSWIFKASFYVNAYTVEHTNGKIYVVYAHDFNDMEWFLTRLDAFEEGLATYDILCYDRCEKRKKKSYIPDKKRKPKKKPFWYRGRVYELTGEKK